MLTALDAPENVLDDGERNVVAMIREHGWFKHHIFAEGQSPSFDFTTGFQVTLDTPELITFSFAKDTAHRIFWNVFNDVKAGMRLEAGREYSDFANLPVIFQPVAKTHYPEHLGWSRWFYGGDNFDCWQMIWSDRDGRFPWDVSFDTSMIKFQPDLSGKGWNGRLTTSNGG